MASQQYRYGYNLTETDEIRRFREFYYGEDIEKYCVLRPGEHCAGQNEAGQRAEIERWLDWKRDRSRRLSNGSSTRGSPATT